MIPDGLNDFLVATVTASASFIGLLFVAMTLTMDKSGKDKKRIAIENIMAESSYISLLNVFFISLVALIPKTGIGIVTIIMAMLGLSNSQRLVRKGSKDGVSRGILGVTTLVYLLELIFGIYVLVHKDHVINESAFQFFIIFLFASALARAWELTGIHRND